MKKLARPATPPAFIDYLISIREARTVQPGGINHKALLTSMHNEIATCFKAFETAIGTGGLDQLLPYAPLNQISDSLRGCYAGSTIGIRRVKQLVANAQPPRALKYCPMCGTTLPRTHDHYLPASIFPEFSVHALNLIPCCAQCNSIKDDGWLDAAGKRRFLHLFSDELPAPSILTVTLKELSGLQGVGALFQLKRPADVPDPDWELVESHYKCLHLLDRYDEQASDEIGEILADCGIYLQETGGKDASSFLSRRADERASVYGPSHWRVVLMQALADSPKLSVWISRASIRTI